LDRSNAFWKSESKESAEDGLWFSGERDIAIVLANPVASMWGRYILIFVGARGLYEQLGESSM
jgi:hypothetical protein